MSFSWCDRRWTRGAAVVISTLAAACGGGPNAGWVEHKDPGGFRITHPPGWTVSTRDDGLISLASADSTSLVLVQPFFLRERIGADAWLRRTPKQFASVFPGATVVRVERRPGSDDTAIASLTYSAGGRPFRGTALCAISGASGMFYAIAAAADEFAARRADLVRILRSLSFTSMPATPPARPAVEFSRWQDPRENAFTVEVPAGWTTSGGAFRFASVDIRPAVRSASPDREVELFLGDADLPTFVMPNQVLAMAGFTEGSWYSPGYGVRMLVRSYVSGSRFADAYVRTTVARQCANPDVRDVRATPELVRELNQLYQSLNGVSVRLDAGEAAFECGGNTAPRRGYVFAATQTTATAAGALWNVQHLAGYLAVPARAALAEAALRRLVASFALNPQWVAMQQGITAATSQIVSKTGEAISSIINETYWNRQKTMDNVFRNWSNMTLGQTDVRDPDSGETWKVASGHNYYWRKGDTIAGTSTYDRPDIDFTPLVEW